MTVDLALHGSVSTRRATKWKDQAAFEDFIVKQLTHACRSTRRKKNDLRMFPIAQVVSSFVDSRGGKAFRQAQAQASANG